MTGFTLKRRPENVYHVWNKMAVGELVAHVDNADLLEMLQTQIQNRTFHCN